MTYFEKMVEIKSPFKSKSLLIKRFDNPEELPVINKKNIITLMNLTKIERSKVLTKTVGVQGIPQQRSLNMRIKKIVR